MGHFCVTGSKSGIHGLDVPGGLSGFLWSLLDCGFDFFEFVSLFFLPFCLPVIFNRFLYEGVIFSEADGNIFDLCVVECFFQPRLFCCPSVSQSSV